MTNGRKSASDVREEAYRLAKEAAVQRDKDGDPEGAQVLRDLARDIIRIPILPRQGATDSTTA